MLFLLSPAKSLDFETAPHVEAHTQPLFTSQSRQLIKLLRDKTPVQISELMSLSDTLAGLNVGRYQASRNGLAHAARVGAASAANAPEPTGLGFLQATARDRKNVFAALMEAVKTHSLGQISHALYEVGGEYRRNM